MSHSSSAQSMASNDLGEGFESPKNITKDQTTSDEAVRSRAYEFFKERGGEDGHAEEDWLRAEAEISQQRSARSDV